MPTSVLRQYKEALSHTSILSQCQRKRDGHWRLVGIPVCRLVAVWLGLTAGLTAACTAITCLRFKDVCE